MEYVKGNPLFEYCRENKLTLKERLRIFRQVCEAVQAVHNIKVVHRDLKPSNILVNAEGIPKLLDFGIAKLLDPELAAATVELTLTHWRMLTPQYASPEQIYGGDISYTSDIYSLGVLLYELVAGEKPYRFSSSAPHEISRVICEQEPLRPSSFVRGQSHKTTGDEQRRADDELTEDLDKIILKTLRKKPAERYQTADELREDIGKYPENRPVSANFFTSKTDIGNVSLSRDTTKHSIAILPLKILNSGKPDDTNEFLGIGLADALTMRLSNVRRFLVRPTSSVLPFGKREIDPFAAGRKLGVDFIVDGNIRLVGNRIRVAAQLLNVGENSTRWAQRFDENFTDVLALEDSISERVTKSLLPKLTGEEQRRLRRRGTNSPEAYEAFMRARFYFNQFKPDTYPKALEWAEKSRGD